VSALLSVVSFNRFLVSYLCRRVAVSLDAACSLFFFVSADGELKFGDTALEAD